MNYIKRRDEKTGSEDWHDLSKRLDAIIAKQNAYNNREDSRYTRQILLSLNFALLAAAGAINGAYNAAVSQKSLSPIISAVSIAKAEYQSDNEDEGYGCGCLGSVLNSLVNLQQDFISQGFEQAIATPLTPEVNHRQRVKEETIGIERIAKEFGFREIELLGANTTHPEEIVFKIQQNGNNDLNEHKLNECTLALGRLLRFEIILKFETK